MSFPQISVAQAVRTQLAGVSGLKMVGGAAEFQAASESNPVASPAAFVMLLSERAGEPLGLGFVHQHVHAEIGVTLAIRNLADAKGASASTDIESLRVAVCTALLGFVPVTRHGRCDPVAHGGGSLLAFRDGFFWWQDVYSTGWQLSSQ